ncbi:TetR/AcrR family transcriptional regulator [Paucibacter sp. XJ19-41]|uniref:TetR/AcrR family transcriptional regulator n=1 Tax=Paucibacter sp. XJ19-41 TaxID=2927824 RepID=UPI00234A100C|nr:TetR family transcriptional regulator [Paucibacter sp. XJ19-41]MDC6168021.1 TetR family transcriptional regulator [Paucibacter sp. XJ19-41]
MGKKAQQAADSRARLIAQARALFQTQGYSATSTETLLAATGLTRGALYHHFRDKKDLFQAVCEQMHGELAQAIEAATADVTDDSLRLGSLAWMAAVGEPGRCRVLLIDAPAVLGEAQWEALDARHGYAALQQGLREMRQAHTATGLLQSDALAAALNGAMNQLARWSAEQGTEAARHEAARVIEQLLAVATQKQEKAP